MFYKTAQTNYMTNQNVSTRHIVFYFAEKDFLPKLQNQPGQFHFITGLKLDHFGIYTSYEGFNYIVGLPEGHWLNKNTSNVVISMLHYKLDSQRTLWKPEGQQGAYRYTQIIVLSRTKTYFYGIMPGAFSVDWMMS